MFLVKEIMRNNIKAIYGFTKINIRVISLMWKYMHWYTQIIKNDKPDVATGNFRIAFNEVWYDQVCLMHACNNTGTKFKSLKYVYSLIDFIQLKLFIFNFYTSRTWHPSKCKKGSFPRWGSNSQPRHILTHTVYKYRALTDCATGEGGNFCPISWYSKLMFNVLVVMMVINQYKDIKKYFMVWITTSDWKFI